MVQREAFGDGFHMGVSGVGGGNMFRPLIMKGDFGMGMEGELAGEWSEQKRRDLLRGNWGNSGQR